MKTPFSISFITGKEKEYVSEAIKLSGASQESLYKARCEEYLKTKWGFKEVHLTTSCTASLEISALLIDLRAGDEVIIPSYTFPSTANAFIRQGAKIVFADSRESHPGIDEERLEQLITEKTKAIVPVHYAGIACDMDKISELADKYNLYVIEDAAHAFDAFYRGRPLGSIGHLGCLSFHRTKNIQCMEGGAIIINDNKLSERVSCILEKGTNRRDFNLGKTEKYEWVEIGSSFAMNELNAAYLYGQLEASDEIRHKRRTLWEEYHNSLIPLRNRSLIKIPEILSHTDHNAHIFFTVTGDLKTRNRLKAFLAEHGVDAAGHYYPLHISEYWKKHSRMPVENKNSLMYSECLLRLPLYNEMTIEQVKYVSSVILSFYNA